MQHPSSTKNPPIETLNRGGEKICRGKHDCTTAGPQCSPPPPPIPSQTPPRNRQLPMLGPFPLSFAIVVATALLLHHVRAKKKLQHCNLIHLFAALRALCGPPALSLAPASGAPAARLAPPRRFGALRRGSRRFFPERKDASRRRERAKPRARPTFGHLTFVFPPVHWLATAFYTPLFTPQLTDYHGCHRH